MRTVIVVPAYNAAKTIRQTVESLYAYVADPKDIIVCDDFSRDGTERIARDLPVTFIRHTANKGYGGNQKTLYKIAFARNPGAVVMIHGDNQYDPASIPAMIHKIELEKVDLVLGNRIPSARKYGMPIWRLASNRLLSLLQNTIYKKKMSEYHSGLRAYSARLIEHLPFESFSDDFVFDTQLISWAVKQDYRLDEVPTNCYYRDEVSSINFLRSLNYGLRTVGCLISFIRSP